MSVSDDNYTTIQEKMRKGLLIVIAVFCAFVAKAESVSRAEAQKKALAFMQSKGRSMSQAAAPVSRMPRKKAPQQDASCYYVFNADGGSGFVIVSGDDRTVPVLGYSLSGSFSPDSIPENMKAWLQGYADQIDALDSLGITAKYETTETAQAANISAVSSALSDGDAVSSSVLQRSASVTYSPIAPMLMSEWDQGLPYNLNCPQGYSDRNGQRYYGHCYSGCVATAVAQVMYYHRWPEEIMSDIPKYESQALALPISGVPAGTPIRWNDMTDTYPGYAYYDYYGITAGDLSAIKSIPANIAVAELMSYCGTALEMNYGFSGSGAFDTKIAPALRNYFGYDENLYRADRSEYSMAQWDALLYGELANKRPVIYAGKSTGGGHQFVLDGYSDGLFHVNWGWGGSCDGYFAVSVLNPYSTSGMGASSTSDGYSMGQSAIIGVQPAGSANPMPPHDLGNFLTIKNLHTSGTKIMCDVYNYLERVDDFYMGYFILGADGQLDLLRYYDEKNNRNYLSYWLAEEFKTYKYYPNQSLDLATCELAPGQYKICFIGVPTYCFSSLLAGEMNFNTDNYVLATVAADGSVSLELHPTVQLEASDFVMPESPEVGREQIIRATIRNLGDEFNGTLYAFAAAESDEEFSLVMMTGAAIPMDGSTDIEFFIMPEKLENYTILLSTDESCSNVIGTCVLKMVPDPVFALELSDVILPDAPSVGREQTIELTIVNNGDAYSGPLTVKGSPGPDLYTDYLVKDVDINAGRSMTLRFSFTPEVYSPYTFVVTAGDNIIGTFLMSMPEHSELLGDIDNDGRLSVADIVVLSRYISDGNAAGIITTNADINGDGRINVADVVELARLVSTR